MQNGRFFSFFGVQNTICDADRLYIYIMLKAFLIHKIFTVLDA